MTDMQSKLGKHLDKLGRLRPTDPNMSHVIEAVALLLAAEYHRQGDHKCES